MNENSTCPIWGTTAVVHPSQEKESADNYVDSPRAGGKYIVTGNIGLDLKHRDDRFKARLTSWLIEQRRLGVERPEIAEQTIKEMEQRQHLPVHERADRLLRHIEKQVSHVGELVDIFGQSPTAKDKPNQSLVVLSETESIIEREVIFLLNYLDRRGWLEGRQDSPSHYLLTVKGYARLAELDKAATDLSQAFVAMWFDPTMNDVYDKGIKPGICNAGYKPLRIDRKEHSRKIDDLIIAEIRRSRFVVADFTHRDIEDCKNEKECQNAGARGGVYYEAGFARGLHKDVIFTCRKDVADKVHFDIRQYNRIEWEDPEDLQEKLTRRITAVMGYGPSKKEGQNS